MNSNPKCPNCFTNLGVETLFKNVNHFQIIFCQNCLNGFTYPVPKNLNSYYPISYWNLPSIFGKIRNFIYLVLQKRRSLWVKEYLRSGKILDVGAGEGVFGKTLDGNFDVLSLEMPSAKIKNKSIIKKDFLKWKTSQKFDAVVFWESLEHTPKPEKYLKKTFDLIKDNGLVFIEYPRFKSLEANIFGKHWYHLDTPRHLVHLTDRGLINLLERVGFKLILSRTTLAPEYSLTGLVFSILNFFRIKPAYSPVKEKLNLFIILTIPLFLPALFFELILNLTDQSPIGLVVAKKVKNVKKA